MLQTRIDLLLDVNVQICRFCIGLDQLDRLISCLHVGLDLVELGDALMLTLVARPLPRKKVVAFVQRDVHSSRLQNMVRGNIYG